MAAYRATPHEVTKFTPNFLFLGREVYAPLDLALGFEAPNGTTTVEGHVTDLVETMTYAYELVRDYTGHIVQRRKRRYDMRVRPKAFKVNDWVLYYYPRRRPGKSAKWGHGYIGPCIVVGVINDLSYWIQKSTRSLPEVVHVDKLKAFMGEPPQGWTIQYRGRPEPEIENELVNEEEVEDDSTSAHPPFTEAAEDLLLPDPVLNAGDFDEWTFGQDEIQEVDDEPPDLPDNVITEVERSPEEADQPVQTEVARRPKRNAKEPVRFQDYLRLYGKEGLNFIRTIQEEFTDENGKDSSCDEYELYFSILFDPEIDNKKEDLDPQSEEDVGEESSVGADSQFDIFEF